MLHAAAVTIHYVCLWLGVAQITIAIGITRQHNHVHIVMLQRILRQHDDAHNVTSQRMLR